MGRELATSGFVERPFKTLPDERRCISLQASILFDLIAWTPTVADDTIRLVVQGAAAKTSAPSRLLSRPTDTNI